MTNTRTKIVAAAVGLTATLGACSSSPSADGPTSTSPVSTTPSTAAGVTTSTAGRPSSVPSPTAAPSVPSTLAPANTLPKGACATSQVSVVLGAEGAAAGSRYYPIVFTNISPTSCTITGSPGVSLVDAERKQLGDPATSAGAAPAATVTLAPGTKASALLGIGTAEYVPGCAIATSTDLRVYPPGNTDPVFVALATHVCTEPGKSLESVQPVVAGDTGQMAPG